MKLRKLALASILAAFGILLGAGSAAAAPVWNLELHHAETNFPPGETGEVWFSIANVGDEETGGPITLTVTLPGGLSRAFVAEEGWSCPGSPGDQVVTCTTETTFPRHTYANGINGGFMFLSVGVNVDPAAAGQSLLATATLEGGGAPAPTTDSESIQIGGGPAGFGIVPGSWKGDFYEADGLTPVREAGSHPDLATFAFDFNNVADPTPAVPDLKLPAESIRDIEVELPPGFVGNPSAVGECTAAQLAMEACPRSSQVGRIDVGLEGTQAPGAFLGLKNIAVFNMAHPRGAVTDLAFNVTRNIIHIKAELDPANDYAIKTLVSEINHFMPVYYQKLTIWGVPGHPSHNSERCYNELGYTGEECPTESSGKPFLTVPSRCDIDHEMRLFDYDSWQNPGVFGPEIKYPMPGRTTDCDRPRFEPELDVNPTGQEANSPAGLEVNLAVPQNENVNGLATPPVKGVKVTLPEGMTVSPSFANGLAGCSLSQFGMSAGGIPNPAAVGCPDNSRIGAVSLTTPLLPQQLEGSLYLANQDENPFGSTFAVYLAIHDTEERGVLLKIPGRLDLDPATGQITTTFDDLPQFPLRDFTLAFRSGQRAPLINPPSCGSQRIAAQIASYARPDDFIDVSSTYEVTKGAKGSACPASPGSRPFSPQLNAGTANPNAGSYSPFLFRLVREDQEQEFSRIGATLPLGATAKIAGIPLCPETAIAAISGAAGTGRAQLASPSCPVASRIGTVSTGVGAGTEPDYFGGSAYLAGPYKGAPLSLAVVVPALAGPYDLGSVVVRAGIFVDPETAQVRVQSDPLPSIVHGVLLRIRDVRVNVDRSETMLNPTSCDPMAVEANVLSTGGAAADPFNRFQVGNCGRLGFAPKLAFKLKGGTNRGDYPALEAILRARPGDANIAKAAVTLPHSEFLAQEHIKTICTRVQFAADACPPGSIYGRAKAITPLLDQPLQGPVYLRSSSNPLPDLVAKLNGTFEVHLVGKIDSVNQGIRNRFEVVPDAPVTKFTLNLQGGRKGLLVNSRSLCEAPARAKVRMVGQNGKTQLTRPVLSNGCEKGKRVKPRQAGVRRG